MLVLYLSVWLIAPRQKPYTVAAPLPPPGPAAAPVPSIKLGVPAFVRALGMRPGISTERDLERQIGAGEVCVGGHSNSGRYWSFANGLDFKADGFDRAAGRSLFLDILVFEDWNGSLGDTPELAKYGFGVWGKLCVGMNKDECLRLLPSDMPPPVITQDEITWTQQGLSRRNAKPVMFDYEATLHFSGEKLEYLRLCYDALTP
ncbi:uncharacterized protein KY384_000073 [Bacidia gigantensis]|uniref:uncharacterized protein n=1 Tax=Bacidia gigantensis TaxID=2732470 RepID=UPI001D04EE67|nr:uncharacterized protein KY384_000073 [Bacidia gigantensis]KAG8526081.1 hypothetical protein KY384_000073 [Bacidia gigantensis]